MPTKRKSKTRKPSSENLSPAELAWLTGDDSQIDPDGFAEFFLWSLNHGFESVFRGRTITPAELLSQYGHLATPGRRRELRKMVKRFAQGRMVVKGGRLIRMKFGEKPEPSNIPDNVRELPRPV